MKFVGASSAGASAAMTSLNELPSRNVLARRRLLDGWELTLNVTRLEGSVGVFWGVEPSNTEDGPTAVDSTTALALILDAKGSNK